MKNLLIILSFLICGILSAQKPKFEVLRGTEMDTAEMNAVLNPVEGWYVDNTDTNTLWRYSGTVWENTGGSGGAGTNFGIVASGTRFISGQGTVSVIHSLGYAPDLNRIVFNVQGGGTYCLNIGNITSTTFEVINYCSTQPSTINWAIFGNGNATPMTGTEIESAIDATIGTGWKTSSGGDFLADGSVPMTGSIDMAANDIINVRNLTLDGNGVIDTNGAAFDMVGDMTPEPTAVWTLPNATIGRIINNEIVTRTNTSETVDNSWFESVTSYVVDNHCDAGAATVITLPATNTIAAIKNWTTIKNTSDTNSITIQGNILGQAYDSNFNPVKVLSGDDVILPPLTAARVTIVNTVWYVETNGTKQ